MFNQEFCWSLAFLDKLANIAFNNKQVYKLIYFYSKEEELTINMVISTYETKTNGSFVQFDPNYQLYSQMVRMPFFSFSTSKFASF